MQISVVVPLFNEEESLPELIGWIERVMNANSFTYEVILVDDGSRDKSWPVIEKLGRENPNVKGIRFRKKLWQKRRAEYSIPKGQGRCGNYDGCRFTGLTG